MFGTRAAQHLIVLTLLPAAITIASASAQSRQPAEHVILEPPEMLQAPTPYVQNPVTVEFFDALKGMKNDFNPESIGPLEVFIAKHPDYPEALYVRGEAEACSLTPPDRDKALADLTRTLSLGDRFEYGVRDQDALSIIAKIQLSRGDTTSALKSMTAAMMADLDSPVSIFRIVGVKPEVSAEFCTWNLSDIETLRQAAPHDWRPVALQALYYRFFTSFDQTFYPQVEAILTKATQVDPNSPIPVYLLGSTFSTDAFMSLKAIQSDTYRNEQRARAIQLFTKAIALDPSFSLAYAARAEDHLNMKQDALAIHDFDKVIALSPENTTAHSDRGLAELDIRRYAEAIHDFDFSLDKEKPDGIYAPQLNENRADAFLGLGDARRAVEDYSSAIRARLQTQLLSLNVPQLRALYPEYEPLSDAEFLKEIAEHFVSGTDTSHFTKTISGNDGKWSPSLLNELYEKRGSVYIELGDFRRGITDYQRIFNGMPDFASSTERWQPLGEFGHGNRYFLDVKASEVSRNKMPLLWVKDKTAKGTEVTAYTIDCSGHRVSQASSTSYNQENVVTGSSGESGWMTVTPDTLGEQLWIGVCSAL